jgi:hypothetical protein
MRWLDKQAHSTSGPFDIRRRHRLEVRIVRELAGLLLDLAFHFMKLAFDLIFRARFPCVAMSEGRSLLDRLWHQKPALLDSFVRMELDSAS